MSTEPSQRLDLPSMFCRRRTPLNVTPLHHKHRGTPSHGRRVRKRRRLLASQNTPEVDFGTQQGRRRQTLKFPVAPGRHFLDTLPQPAQHLVESL